MKSGEIYINKINREIIKLITYKSKDLWKVMYYNTIGEPEIFKQDKLVILNLSEACDGFLTGSFIFNNYYKCKVIDISERPK